MGLLEKIFPKNKSAERINQYFKTMTAYTPTFTSYNGGIYEWNSQERAFIHLQRCAQVEAGNIQGSAYRSLEKTLQFKPNP